MTPRQRSALKAAERYHEGASGEKWKDASWPSNVNAGVLASCVRRGWMRSREQSGGCRHEGLTRWTMYQITPAGIAALDQAKDGGAG